MDAEAARSRALLLVSVDLIHENLSSQGVLSLMRESVEQKIDRIKTGRLLGGSEESLELFV